MLALLVGVACGPACSAPGSSDGPPDGDVPGEGDSDVVDLSDGPEEQEASAEDGSADSPGWTCVRDPRTPVLDRVGGSATVIREGTDYHMWYEGFSGASGCFFDTVSGDGTAWTPAGWDDAHRSRFERHGMFPSHFGPAVLADPEGGYSIYYCDDPLGAPPRLARARSGDGVQWSDEALVLEPGAAGAWDGSYVGGPTVLRDGDRQRMWYMGYEGDDFPPEAISIGLAVSEDGVRWERHEGGPVLGPGAAGRFDDWQVYAPAVVAEDDHLVMWYTATSRATWPEMRSAIGVATSPDGVVWTRQGDAVLAPEEPWEADGTGAAAVLVEDTGHTLWYTGVVGGEPSIGRAFCRRTGGGD